MATSIKPTAEQKRLIDRLFRHGDLLPSDIEKAKKTAVETYISNLKDAVVKIDSKPADNGAYHTQQKWLYWMSNHKMHMADAKDVLKAGWVGNSELLKSLRTDFKKGKLILPDRIVYSPHNLSAIISLTRIFVPDYSEGERIDKVASNPYGEKLLLAIFNKNVKVNQILDDSQKLSGKGVENILLKTPRPEYRPYYPEHAVSFTYNHSNQFVISLDTIFNKDQGFARTISERG